jgi:hypothetical protein
MPRISFLFLFSAWLTGMQPAGVQLSPDDLILQPLRLNYAMKDGRNPVDSVLFFSRWDQNTSFTVTKPQASMTLLAL